MSDHYTGKHRGGICAVCAHRVLVRGGVAVEHVRRIGALPEPMRCEGSGHATWKMPTR